MKFRQLASMALVGLAMLVVGCQAKKPSSSGYGSSNGLSTVYFDYDQAFIRSDAASALQNNANYLRKNVSTSVSIEGHCDERGTNEYNLALGQRRAQSAKDYIVNLGIGDNRMRTVSYGEEKPACYESNESCWSRNRRADFNR